EGTWFLLRPCSQEYSCHHGRSGYVSVGYWMAENRRISVGLVPTSQLPLRLRRVPAASKRCLLLETRLKPPIFLRFVVLGISPRILNLMLQNTLFFDE